MKSTDGLILDVPEDVGSTSQLSIAWRLKTNFGSDIRFCPSRGWIVWDGSRWAQDSASVIQFCERVSRALFVRAAKDFAVAREIAKDAKGNKCLTQDEAQKIAFSAEAASSMYSFAKSSQNGRAYKDALSHSETFPELRIKNEEVDAIAHLLGVKNGTIDLRTGELRASLREEYITRISPVEYSREDYSEWTSFLMNALEDDSETVDWIQQFAGYCMTGDASQEVFLFVHGPPRNGKSTLIEAIGSVLGEELAICVDFDALCRKPNGGSQNYDSARMKGVRFVRTSESDKSQRLDEGLVCRWVGGEKIRGRALYKDPFDFMPAFKLAFSVNGKPRINPDLEETGIWERMAVLWFANPTIPNHLRDPGIKRWWTDPAGGGKKILAWAVDGAVQFYKNGMRLPRMTDRMLAARELYRRECDIVGRFMEESAVVDSFGFYPCEELRVRFVRWLNDRGETGFPIQNFLERIQKDPWRAKKRRKRLENGTNVNVWSGIRPKSFEEDDTSFEYGALEDEEEERAAIQGQPTNDITAAE